ncbi:adenine-specific DNA-methyltransferase [Kribbella sp. VKM Ac-2571]|nr:adenine-specific DNA-methyltransferase [Kribbella sp. VKM Ac-2571]
MDDDPQLEDLTTEQLIELVQERTGAGVHLAFPGKRIARQLGRRVRPRVQRTVSTYSAGSADGRAKNLLLEGDNLQALASLYRERGHVDLVFADPPYNTGNDFRYNDRWDQDPNDEGLGDYVSSDDPGKHTKWMKFMYPRLQMLRAMLKRGGVIAVCIDHRELFHLGQMMDELFGEKNRLAILNWQKSYSPRSDNRHVSTATEYVLVYARDEEYAKSALLPRTDAMDARYRSPDGDPRLWKGENFSGPKASTHQGMVYGIQSPFTGAIHYPPEGKCWRAPIAETLRWLVGWGVEYEARAIDDAAKRAAIVGVAPDKVRPVQAVMLKTPLATAKRRAKRILKDEVWPIIVFGLDGEARPQQKKYLEDVKRGRVPMTYWADDDHEFPETLGSISWDHEESGHSQAGVNELSAVVGKGHGFETVKPLKLVEKIIQIWCPPDGLVLDPFAGSGTTGHAILATNAIADANRRFILIEQGRPESGDSYAKTLTADRLSRVISGKWANGKGRPLDGGFTFKTLTKRVDAETLLKMERDEMVDTVIASHFDSSRRRGSNLRSVAESEKYRYLVAKNADDDGVYLVWDGPSENTDLTEEVYEACVNEGSAEGLSSVYHIYSRLNLFVTDDVHWYQIPDRILMDFGLNLRTDAYSETEEGEL